MIDLDLDLESRKQKVSSHRLFIRLSSEGVHPLPVLDSVTEVLSILPITLRFI